MLRHFLNATARTSSRSLFTKQNPLFSGGLNLVSSTARTSSRSLFTKPNPLFSGGLNFFSSTARTSSRSLPVEPKLYVLSLRSPSAVKLCASEMYSDSGLVLQSVQKIQKAFRFILALVLGFAFLEAIFLSSTVWSRWTSAEPMDQPARQLTSIVPLATKEPDLREWTRANMEFKMIDRRGSEMPPNTYFWSKAIVAPETMPKLKEILDALKSEGARVEESDNYYFVEATVDWKKKRFAELMIWLEEPGHKYFRAVEEREKIREAKLQAQVDEKRRTLGPSEYAWGSQK